MLKFIRLYFSVLIIACTLNTSVIAQGLIRDAEIEYTLQLIARPLLEVAGISPYKTKIFIINSHKLNAFVAVQNNIFIYRGLIQKLQSIDLLQAVIAHEIAHITGKHLIQRIGHLDSAYKTAGLGFAFGIATALVGAPGLGVGLALGTQSTAQRLFFGNTRAQEASADQSGVRYMAAAGIDPNAALEVLKIFEGQNLLTAKQRDPYTLTHPISQERINSLRNFTQVYKPKPNPKAKQMQYWYKRMQTKINGFTNNPTYTLRHIKAKDSNEIATLTRAIAYHRLPNPKKALANTQKLLQIRPNDGFYYDLYGQILLENNKISAAIAAYRTAIRLLPRQPLIQASLGRALLAVNDKNSDKQALKILRNAYIGDPYDARMLRDLSIAYARAGQNGMASLAIAERYVLFGDFKQAIIHAKRAQKLLIKGSSAWLKADEILNTVAKTKKQNKR